MSSDDIIWLKKLDFERAMIQIQKESRKGKDFCLDPLRFEDLSTKSVRSELIKKINESVSGLYFMGGLITVDVPKANYILRPAARPRLTDWIVYDAVVTYIATEIHSCIPDRSYSFPRFVDSISGKKRHSSIDYWRDFENEALKLATEGEYDYLLTTDIVSFFEHISLKVLRDRLKMLSNDDSYVQAVDFLTDEILMKWASSGKIKEFGLPQGPNASLVLADIYLYPVDKKMEAEGIKYFRYMDDIRIYAKDKTELKRSIQVIVKALRDLKLNLNAKKTSIYLTNDSQKLEVVFDKKHENLNNIDLAIKSKDPGKIDSIKAELYEIGLNSMQTDTTFSERHLSFFIGRILELMKMNLVEKVYVKELTVKLLDVFEDKHHQSRLICWYLVAASFYLTGLKAYIQQWLIMFVCDKKRNIYEWQEMWALDTIRQLGPVARGDLHKLKANYAKKSEVCTAQFLLIAGMSGSADDREEVLDLPPGDGDLYRAKALALQELNQDVVQSSGFYIPRYFKNYLSTLKSPTYGFVYDLQIAGFEDVHDY